jgi:hypothetical protein
MNIKQLISFLFKRIMISLMWCASLVICYLVDFKALTNIFVNLSLYQLAKIWLVFNLGALMYYIINYILLIHFSKILKENKKVDLSDKLPSFLTKWFERIINISDIESKEVFVDIYVKNIIIYIITTSLLIYFLFFTTGITLF